MPEGKTYSLSRRMILSISVMLCLFWVAAVMLGIRTMRDEFDEVFDSGLQETTERLMPLLVEDLYSRDNQTGPYRVFDPKSEVDEEYLTYQLRDANGRVLLHSSQTPATPYDAPLKPGFWSDANHRVYTMETVSGSLFVQVADSLDHRNEAIREGAFSLILPVMILLPLAMLFVWLITRQAIAPVERLLHAVSSRDGGNLAPILASDLPKELADIPASINKLMARLDNALQAERDIAANSAHELRTPIAGALAQTELLVKELEGHAARPRAEQVLKGLRRLSTMLEKLLQLARAEAGIGIGEQPVAIEPLFDLVLSDICRAYPQLLIEVRKDNAESGPIARRIDADAFAIALQNLMENAARYAEPGTTVKAMLCADGTVTVSNISADPIDGDVNALRQRFRRGRSTAPGSGLGLAIVERLISQMGGRLDLAAEREPSGQTVFTARLHFSENPASPA
ncbi:ATP-binding protein [Allorhizobium undicola]|uniref:ATP-binding protein n=1 Tax=Allorhizobium undicola TaxID=78527 RepID=UPI003D34B5A1